MKKFILVLIVFSMGAMLFSQETETVMPQVRLLLDDGLLKNETAISTTAMNLTDTEKSTLVNQYEKELGVPLAVNFFLGLGIGSFIQKDYLGGGIALGGELLSYGVLLAGVIPLYIDIFNPNITTAEMDKTMETAIPLFITGGAIFLSTRIFEIIRPILYTNSYNNTLKEALGVSKLSYFVAPSYDFENEKPTLVASLNIAL